MNHKQRNSLYFSLEYNIPYSSRNTLKTTPCPCEPGAKMSKRAKRAQQRVEHNIDVPSRMHIVEYYTTVKMDTSSHTQLKGIGFISLYILLQLFAEVVKAFTHQQSIFIHQNRWWPQFQSRAGEIRSWIMGGTEEVLEEQPLWVYWGWGGDPEQ